MISGIDQSSLEACRGQPGGWSEGVAGGIQVDTVTYKRLYSRYQFDEPQTLQVKGKGLMQCYRLLGKREKVGHDQKSSDV